MGGLDRSASKERVLVFPWSHPLATNLNGRQRNVFGRELLFALQPEAKSSGELGNAS
jgi:hypothetical protein